MSEKRLVVFISGQGSNLAAILDAIEQGNLKGKAKVAMVFSNEAYAPGLKYAQQRDIPTEVLPHINYHSRVSYDHDLIEVIKPYEPDLIVLAGFMRILSPVFIMPYWGKILNIHPSLLPKYPGLNTHQKALDAQDVHHGATVHFVTVDLDGGPILAQTRLSIRPNDTASSLASRLLEQEHLLYPKVIEWFCDDRLTLSGQEAQLDGHPIEMDPLD